jgi:hypothetical protein
MDFTIGRRGLVGYLKALGGSNTVKIVPSASASDSQANGQKRLKVVCGANTAYLDDQSWIGEKTPFTMCEVRVSPHHSLAPNIGSLELADALNRVLPFTAKEDTRPVLQGVRITAKEGKLTLVSADGFRLAVIVLDCEGEGEALITRDDLKGIANALRKAKRARISFEAADVSKPSTFTLETELIRYKWTSLDGKYPDYEKLVPTEHKCSASFDTIEALRALASLKVVANAKAYPIDLALGNGKLVLSTTDGNGQADVNADTDGDTVSIRVDGGYLAEALRASGGMVDLKLADSRSPMLFSTNGYKLVVMPMMTSGKPKAEAEAPSKAVAEAEEIAEKAEAVAEAEAVVAEAEESTESTDAEAPKKSRRNRKVKEPVAV